MKDIFKGAVYGTLFWILLTLALCFVPVWLVLFAFGLSGLACFGALASFKGRLDDRT